MNLAGRVEAVERIKAERAYNLALYQIRQKQEEILEEAQNIVAEQTT
ncbi:MAG: hypothetical protein Q7O66_23075 [Dehalococcoidia bacterium]|nr:hypothetical protein [Dehalococcoidia bacterium]